MENTNIDTCILDLTDEEREEIHYLLTGGERIIGGKKYVVKSVFLEKGRDIKSTILKLAERKTVREMGLNIPLNFD